ncbi:MAG: TonB-dependent receptor [Acidobacteria bacterium]|nr:TonB-dependent receptor [Acidobacteriota bacterium]
MFVALGMAPAQETTGAITGTVSDPTGSVIPSASVALRNQGTEVVVRTETGGDGVYMVRDLPPGRYTVTFEAPGFKTQEAPDGILLTGKTLRINATLEVGDVTETVVVTEAAQLIDTASTMVAQNITSEEFTLVPKGRSFTGLAVLSPSVNTGQLEGGFQINGASGAENNYYIDGVSTNSVINGGARQAAQFDYLQEVQVKTSGLEAEYGGALGGVVTAVTKSGGNEFHGSAHMYYYGNAIAAGPVKRLELDPNTQATDKYIQDSKQSDNNWEFGGSLGGPIIKNKMFFYTAATPRWRTRNYDYLFGNGADPGSMERKFRQINLFSKLSFNPTDRLRTNFQWLYTPSRQEGALYAYDGFEPNVSTRPLATALAQANDGFNQPEQNYSGQIDFNVTNTSLLTVRGGRYYLNYKEFGIEDDHSYWFITPSSGLAGVPAALQQPAGFTSPTGAITLFDKTTRSHIQVDFTKYFSGLGQHTIKVGAGTMKNVNSVNDSWYGVNGRARIYWDSAFRAPENRGTYGYYLVEDGATQGSTGANINNMYIQDQWRIHPRLTLNLGIRTEQETIPSFARAVKDYAFKFGWGDKISPRLGASYDVFGNGKLKFSGAWARLYDWTKFDLARGTFGADRWHIYYRSLDDLAPFVNPSDPSTWTIDLRNLPGRNLWSGEYRDLRAADFSLLDPNVKPMSVDQMNVGMEWQIAPQTIFSARYSRNHLNRTIEDLGALDAEGNEIYSYGNPGESRFTVFPSSGATCVVEVNGACGFPMPKATRTYNAMELQVTRRYTNGWFGTVSYVYSKLYGNYSGLQNTDEIRAPTIGTSFTGDQQYGGQSYRPGGNANRSFDLDEILFDAYGNPGLEGRLATDRPHVFKLYGGKSFRFGTEIGTFFRAMSGTPITTTVWTVNGIGVYPEGRGDAGRNPFFTQTDLMVAHNVSLGEQKKLRFEFNMDNLFNQKTSMYNFPNFNKEERGASSEINLSQTDLSQGYDWRALLAATPDGEFAKDPRYLKGALFNAGFQGRFLVKFIF